MVSVYSSNSFKALTLNLGEFAAISVIPVHNSLPGLASISSYVLVLMIISVLGIKKAREYISSGKEISAGSKTSVFILLMGEQDARSNKDKGIMIEANLFIAIIQITKNPGTGQIIF